MSDIPTLHRLHDYLRFYAERRGLHLAIRWAEGELNYASLLKVVEDCARAMIAAGVMHGDRVAVIGPARSEYWITFLATAMIGGVWVGINPRYRAPEILHVLTDAAPTLLFHIRRFEDDDLSALVDGLAEQIPSIRRRVTIGTATGEVNGFESFLDTAFETTAETLRMRIDSTFADHPALLVYTSGTTGKPKGALLSHRGLVGRALVQNAMWPCDEIRTVNFLPINHIGCVGFISIYTLVGGGTQVLMERFRPEIFLHLVKREEITVWISLPTIILMVLESAAYEWGKLAPLRWIIWSGAALPRGLIAELRKCGSRLGASYGLTETTGSVSYLPADADDALLSRSIGRPVPPGEVRLADAEGLPVAPSTVGEVQVRPEWTMTGYHRLEAASREVRTPDGWLRTGDLGRADESGCIELVGRLKEMFKSGGYNVYPREVELAIESHPTVSLCAVVPIPDVRFQEVGVAYVQPKPGTSPSSIDILTWCRAHLANFKVPKHVRFLEQIPTLGVGKIDRQALRARAASEFPQPVTQGVERAALRDAKWGGRS